MAEVTLTGVSKSFKSTKAVKDMDLTVPDGAFVVLLGPPGDRKSVV